MGVDASQVSGVLVTRGDVDVSTIIGKWPFREKIVWDNSVEPNYRVFGRYAAAWWADNDTIFIQDDDCFVPAQALLDAYDGTMLLNFPPSEDYPLVGWGAVFERVDALRAFHRYLAHYSEDDVFHRCADVVLTELAPWEAVDLGHEDLPWATGPDRMYRQPEHYREREEVRSRCRRLLSSSPTTA